MKPELLTSALPQLESRLRDIARAACSGTVAIAFSGGLDSRFLAHTATRVGIPTRLLHVRGPHVPAHEHAYAVDWAKRNALACTVISMDPLHMPALRTNPKDRCYHCKTAVFTTLRDAAGLLPLLDGTNASDLGEYRPGLAALAELAIVSPLAATGFRKEDIRAAAAATGMENPTQAAQPCLLTRFPYNTPLYGDRLTSVDCGENAVRTALAGTDFAEAPFRLRYETPETPALHLAAPTIPCTVKNSLAAALAHAGFPNIPIRPMPDLSGYFDKA